MVKTPNGENPLVDGMTPAARHRRLGARLLLDYENRRPEYVAAFLNHLVDWDEVEAELNKAL